MTGEHWDRQLASFARLNPDLPRVDRDTVLATAFVDRALTTLGTAAGPDLMS